MRYALPEPKVLELEIRHCSSEGESSGSARILGMTGRIVAAFFAIALEGYGNPSFRDIS
jgi:hypothetical protein